jgi:hypothetical protein
MKRQSNRALCWSTDFSDGESDGEDVEHEADWVEVQKPRRKKRQEGTVLHGLLAQTFGTNTEAAMFADAVLGVGNSAGATFVSEGKKMPAMIAALSGQPPKQDTTIDMADAAKFGKQQSDELRKGLLQCFIADLDTTVKEPGSYDAGLTDRSNTSTGLTVMEWSAKNSLIFKLTPRKFCMLKQNKLASTSGILCGLSHNQEGAVIEREYKVRYACDESRDPNKS